MGQLTTSNQLPKTNRTYQWAGLVIIIIAAMVVEGVFLLSKKNTNPNNANGNTNSATNQNDNRDLITLLGTNRDTNSNNQDVGIGTFYAPNDYKLLYFYRRFQPEQHTAYTAKFDGGDKQIVDLVADSNSELGYRYYYFYQFPYLIQSNNEDKTVSLIPLNDLSQTRTIISIPDQYTYFGGIIMPVDENRLVFLESRETEPGQHEFGGPRENNIYLINADGSNQSKIYSYIHDRDSGPGFNSFDDKTGEMYLTEGGGGGCIGNLRALNIVTGKMKDIQTSIPDEDVCSIVFNEDHTIGYYLEGQRKVVQYNFRDNSKKLFYESPTGSDGSSNMAFVRGPLLSPDYKQLAFTEHLEPSDKEISKLINIETGEISTLLDDERYYNVGVDSWSPDSNYLWLDTNCFGCGRTHGYDNEGEYYILDVKTKAISQFFKGEKGTYQETGQGVSINEHLDLIGWIPK